jgi:protein-tyrosine phosphatase
VLEGASNFRDLGGYRATDGRLVRRGLIYRSGSLHALTESDLERLRSMGICVAFDLRSPLEHEAEPLAASFIRRVSVPLSRSSASDDLLTVTDGRAFLRARYDEIFFDVGERIGSILRSIAHDECLPAVIHCAAGKDRTGVVAAVLLLALGVDDVTVLDDYELSSECETAHRIEELRAKLGERGLSPALIAGLLGTHRAALGESIGEVYRRFGSIESYLIEAAMLSADDLASLRSRLTF